MATTTKQQATKVHKPVQGRCSLRLRINGATYRVRPIRPEGFGVVKAFTLAQPGFEPYTIALTIEGETCDCGDWTFRRDGTGQPCKHLAAARACGLL